MVRELMTSGSATSWGGRAGEALAVGATAVVWYALPDHVASARTRGVIKGALLLAWAVGSGKAPAGAAERAVGRASAPAPAAAPHDLDDQAARHDPGLTAVGQDRSGPGRRSAVILGAGIASVLVGVGSGRGIHWLGERSARRGARYPHTRNGLVLGLVTALVAVGGRATRG